MEVKICKKCKKELSLTEFYKHKRMKDGHLNFCKSCVKNRMAQYRLKNIEKCREYDKQRKSLPHRKILSLKTTKRRRQEVGYSKAHSRLSKAIKKGLIKKPDRCSFCGKISNLIEGHHEDYSKPLDVVWLCPVCHKILHLGKSELAQKIQHIYSVPSF